MGRQINHKASYSFTTLFELRAVKVCKVGRGRLEDVHLRRGLVQALPRLHVFQLLGLRFPLPLLLLGGGPLGGEALGLLQR